MQYPEKTKAKPMIPGFFRNLFLLLALIIGCACANAQVAAHFVASPKEGCAPLVVKFTDLSTGNPETWQWNLGNGTTSYLQHPSAIYFAPGKYPVTLIVKGASGEDSITKTDFIEVYASPVINFSVNNASGCYPLDVQFTDITANTNGTISSWLWDFGDGGSSTSKDPLHTYNSDKNFNVTLQVKNSNGCAAVYTKNSAVQISSGVLSGFTNNNPKTCTAPVTINFQNTSAGTGVLQYEWNFGDGFTSSEPNPSHTYTNIGSYTISLISINENGCRDTLTKTNAVTVGQVKARIKIGDTICENMHEQIVDASTPAPASVNWYFGDGTTSADFNPLKKYTSSGIYKIKLVANFGACTDSAEKTISVLPKPSASFIADKTTGCAVPFTTNFSAQGTGIVSYQWDFGDSSFSNEAAPVHVYNANGTYTVKLIVVNSNGCTDTLVRSNYISLEKPTIRFGNIPDSSCAPYSKTFTANINSTDPVTQYLWNFGDGSTSNAAAPTHVYTSEGVYTVSLAITTAGGCTGFSEQQRAIIVDQKPVINFAAWPLSSCAKDTIRFSDSSDMGNSRWMWKFGDNTSSTMHNPTHQYIDTGYFDVQLTVWKGGCADSLKISKYVHINAPIARFTITSNCATPYQRAFTDKSIGADEWRWDFGDGSTSSDTNTVHVYAAPGTYTVTLTVVNHTTGCDYTSTRTIRIVDPARDFLASDTVICKGSTVSFTTGLSLNDIKTFNWDFGDGSASVNSTAGTTNKTYTYKKLGSFDVRLITTDVNNCIDTLIKPLYIRVDGANAKFGLSNPGSCLNTSVAFSDSSVTDGLNPINSWVWSYGDGTKDSLLSPPFNHTYKKAGAYNVSLTVNNANGCRDTYKLTAPLIISKPLVDFSTADSASCPGKQVHFISQSSGNSIKYLWNFGDNSTDTATNPSHIYTSDTTYSVKLVVTDRYGCTDSLTRQNFITIKTPHAAFLMSDSFTNCPPLIVKFTDRSTNAISWRWDFGDSTYSTEINPIHFYNFAGEFTITLTVTSKGGCTAVYKNKVDINGPQGYFNYNAVIGCNPVSLNFTAVTNAENKVLWDFNDGNVINSSSVTASHTYYFPGSYLPKMILIDSFGCKVPIPGKDTIKVSGAKAGFNFTNQLFCDTAAIAFKDSSIGINDVIKNYKWTFGDGSSSSLQHPNHLYTTAGVYYPKLVVTTNAGCKDSIVAPAPIKLFVSPKIDINFSGNGCVPLNAGFSRKLLVADTAATLLLWNFGNGNTSSAITPPVQTYTSAGNYTVLLTATSSSGCKTIVTKPVEAYAIPNVSAGTDTILCKGSSITLTATGAATYTWSPSVNLLCVNCASTVTNTPNSTSYYVTGTSTHGCIAKDTIKVNVKDRFVFKHSGPDSICKGESKQLFATGAYAYNWSPAVFIDNSTISDPTVSPDTTTTYRVIAKDEWGCFNDTAFIPVKVNKLPTVHAGSGRTINVGETIELIPEVSDDVIIADWQPTSGIFRNAFPGITVKPKENTEYTVEVKNSGGCKAKDKVTIIVICNGANIYLPNTFSPNNDGSNDIFYPRGTGIFQIKDLKIFNRWGVIVFNRSNFTANNASDGWNGTDRGTPLTPDVYVYRLEVICDNGSTLVYNGNITLIK